MAVNIILAALLVGPMRGAGIALALSLASAVNSIILFAFLKKNPNITIGSTLNSTLKYILKLLIISGLAVVPIHFLSPILHGFFSGRGRITSFGIPLGINLIIYILIGVALLAVSKDKYLFALVNTIKKKGRT